jgi:hypothetical protein
MTSLLVLYNTNPVPLIICVSPSPANAKQQRLGVEEELQEQEISSRTKRKKTRRKPTREVVIREINMRMNSNSMSILRSFQSHVVGKKRMIDDEHPSNDIST